MLIVGLTGPAGAGKDTVADYLVSKYKFKKYSFTDVLMNEAKRRGLEINKLTLSKIGDELRKEGGMDVLAQRLWQEISKSNDNRIVIPNFRSPEEVKYISSAIRGGDKFILVMVSAPPEIRYKRLKDRDGVTYNDFLERDKRDIEKKGMSRVFDMADFYLENNSTIEDLHSLIDDLLSFLGVN